MKKLPNALSLLILISALASIESTLASSIPNNDSPTTFLGPVIKLGFANYFNDYTVYNIGGEAGIRNLRLASTVGWGLGDKQRIKVTAEYLRQKINYAFFSGNSDEWVQQGALGAAFQYDIPNIILTSQFDLSAYVSYSPSVSLNTVTGTFVDSMGVQPYTDNRRIAGSTAYGLSPGISFVPWWRGRIFTTLNYDNVNYDQLYLPNQDANGIGGTVGLNQSLTDHVGMTVSAAFRQPFNHYAMNFFWSDPSRLGAWIMGVFANYVAGKNTLPKTYNGGISFDYVLDQHEKALPTPIIYKDKKMKDAPVIKPTMPTNNLLNWVADPAVYMPQVLAIADVNACGSGNITQAGVIPNPPDIDTTFGPIVTDISTSQYFNGENLSYSVTYQNTIFFGTEPTITINATTGVVTITANAFTFGNSIITVLAYNGCNTSRSTFTVNYITD